MLNIKPNNLNSEPFNFMYIIHIWVIITLNHANGLDNKNETIQKWREKYKKWVIEYMLTIGGKDIFPRNYKKNFTYRSEKNPDFFLKSVIFEEGQKYLWVESSQETLEKLLYRNPTGSLVFMTNK